MGTDESTSEPKSASTRIDELSAAILRASGIVHLASEALTGATVLATAT